LPHAAGVPVDVPPTPSGVMVRGLVADAAGLGPAPFAVVPATCCALWLMVAP
jgi:hypothetical protein